INHFYLYKKKITSSLETIQILIEAETLANNFYGLMSAYDQIGDIYLERQEYAEALTAFEKGLEIAQELKYQESYFTKQIERLKTEIKI
ncbi:MAG: tetratricopeptide repeat protein, partial [Dolichospermum sp.]